MRVALVSRWRATCGVSLHGELVAGALRDRGVSLRVYAPTMESAMRDWHHIPLGRDESFVYRCYDETEDPSDPSARGCRGLIAGWDPDVVIVEGYSRLPARSIGRELWEAWRRGSRIVYVLHYFSHDEAAEQLRYLPPGAIAVFDRRWLREVLYPYRNEVQDYTEVIPYPCSDPVKVEPYRPREAEGKLLFFSFGRQPVEEYHDYVEALEVLSKKYDLAYYVVRSIRDEFPWRKPWLILEYRKLSLEEVYARLYAADIHLLPKGWTWKLVVSSTLYQTLPAATPTVVPDTRYFESVPEGIVVKYWGTRMLVEKLVKLLENPRELEKISWNMRDYYQYCRRDRVAEKLLRLAEKAPTEGDEASARWPGHPPS